MILFAQCTNALRTSLLMLLMSGSIQDHMFSVELTEMYKRHLSILKVKSKEYLYRHMKNVEYKKLVNKLKEKDKNANRDSVVKKINSMLSGFRKECTGSQYMLSSTVQSTARLLCV